MPRAGLARALRCAIMLLRRVGDISVAEGFVCLVDLSCSSACRAGDLTKVPFHFADLGSDVIEAEIAASNTTRLSNELAAIDDALKRFYRAPEHFGICQDTGAAIPFARLDVIPWARSCDEAGA